MGQLQVILDLTAQVVPCLSRHYDIRYHHIRSLLLHQHICRIHIETAQHLIS